MSEQLYKICLSGHLEAVEGCESLTSIQVQEFLSVNQELYDAPLNEENLDTAKYIVWPLQSEAE